MKTRLVSLLGASGAARLHQRLVERSLATAVAARCGPVELHCAPHVGHPFFRRCARRYGVRLRAQAAGDLGERMHAAAAGALCRYRRVVLLGSDCAALRPRDLRAAVRALEEGTDAALVPAEDGGYVLLALRRNARSLFHGISWGGADVLARTERRLRRLGWRWTRLRIVWDVDRPRDVARLRRAAALEPRASTQTAPALRSNSASRSAIRR